MRLGLVTSSYPTSPDDSSNAGVFVRDLAWRLGDLGHDVTVVTPHRVTPSPGQPFSVERFPWPGQERSLTHVDPRHPLNLLRLAVLLASGAATVVRVARRRRLQHVVALWAVPSGLLALAARRLLGVPYSVWALGSDIWKVSSYPLGPFLLRRVLRGASALYADGTALAADVERLSGRPCAFLASSRAMPPVGDVAPAELPAGRTHVLCVARMHPHKGVDVLVDAVGRMTEQDRARLAVHVFGGGPQEADLRAAVRRHGLEATVRIGGFLSRERFMAHLLAADVLVVPSRIESIPLILSDAAQAGCPVVATDVGDMGRLVREHRLGVVVPPEDPDALGAALLLAADGGVRLDRAAAARMVEDLSLAGSAARLLADVGAT